MRAAVDATRSARELRPGTQQEAERTGRATVMTCCTPQEGVRQPNPWVAGLRHRHQQELKKLMQVPLYCRAGDKEVLC